MKLKEEHGSLKSSYQLLQEEHEKLQKQHAEDNGKYFLLTSRLWFDALSVIDFFRLAEAAQKAFDAKVKEHDDFVQKIKKELEQTERRAKEKKSLEKQVHDLQETKKKDDAMIVKLQSDLQKLSELRVEEKKAFESELGKSQQSLQHAEIYCAGRFEFFSEKLSGKY